MTTVRASSSSAARASSSASSARLQLGASCAAVKELQQLLKSLGLYSSAVDGQFGPKTEAAVKQFQKTHGLTVDGWAGPQTMAKLRAAATPKPPATPAPAATGLKQGSTGDAVKEVQMRLKALGLYNGAIGGNFGPSTEAAVKAFQKMKGLPQSGVVDQTTLDKLRGGQAPASSTSIGKGATGNDVKEVQLILTALGFYKSSVDGKFGPVTEGAVKAFQAQQGLPQTGVVNQATLDALRTANANHTPPPQQPNAPITGVLQPGAPVTPPSLPSSGAVQPPGLTPVPSSASKDEKLQAILNYGIYWANLEAQNPNSTAYSGAGSGNLRLGQVGDGKKHQGADASGHLQKPYLAPRDQVCFDCSGLVVAMFKQAGISVPGSSGALRSAGVPADKHALQPGDILAKNGHVVVYIGDGKVVEATVWGSNPGDGSIPVGGVKISDAQKFIDDDSYVARRVL